MVAHTDTELEVMAETLNASGRFRVLRQLQPSPAIIPPDGVETRLGLFVDVETTGLDPTRDEIIELAMLPFTYGLDGRIYEVGDAFQKYREPSKPIPPAITALTGITDEMVAGQTIDPAEIIALASGAALVVAHNAAFDRRFVERLSDIFTAKPWACSMTEIDWSAEGFEGTKLAYLAMGAGFFYERHRAVQDCAAAIALLSATLPRAGVTAMARLLERARRPTWRLWAENSPFGLRDVLKARGYRWNPEGKLNPRAWFIDVNDDAKEAELAFLRNDIYRREIEIVARKITAYDRFSERC
jgi:DNA polymerase-3 subunit epsilon